MERLRDQRDSNDPTVARAADLLDAARPLEKTALPPPAQKPALLGVGVRRLVLRPAFLFLGLLATSAAAATAIWVVVEQVAEEEAAIEEPAPAPERVLPRIRRGRSRTPTIPAVPQVEGAPAPEMVPGTGTGTEPGLDSPSAGIAMDDLPAVEPPEPSPAKAAAQNRESDETDDADESPAPVARRAPPAAPPTAAPGRIVRSEAGPSGTQAPPVAAPPMAPPDPQARLLLDAARALRRRADPREALSLLERYLVRFPQGGLVEEAMGLAIEAAAAVGSRRAAQLGARYLTRFPSGRFREAAQRALQRFQDTE